MLYGSCTIPGNNYISIFLKKDDSLWYSAWKLHEVTNDKFYFNNHDNNNLFAQPMGDGLANHSIADCREHAANLYFKLHYATTLNKYLNAIAIDPTSPLGTAGQIAVTSEKIFNLYDNTYNCASHGHNS